MRTLLAMLAALAIQQCAFAEPMTGEWSRGVTLSPPDTALGEKIWLSVQQFSPPIWFKGADVVQGPADLPWIPAAKAGVIQPGVPYKDIAAFATESFLKEDLSQAEYDKSQKVLAGRTSTLERSVFYAVDVQTKTSHYMIVVGWSSQLLNRPSSEHPPSARLYEMQGGRWLMTSTKKNGEVLALPWNDLAEIDAMVRSGSACKNEFGSWRAGGRRTAAAEPAIAYKTIKLDPPVEGLGDSVEMAIQVLKPEVVFFGDKTVQGDPPPWAMTRLFALNLTPEEIPKRFTPEYLAAYDRPALGLTAPDDYASVTHGVFVMHEGSVFVFVSGSFSRDRSKLAAESPGIGTCVQTADGWKRTAAPKWTIAIPLTDAGKIQAILDRGAARLVQGRLEPAPAVR